MKPSERHLDYQTTIQDIRDHKANQWLFSHYGVLAQAAFAAVDTQLETITGHITELAFSVLSLGAAAGSLFLIRDAQCHIMQRRKRIKELLSNPSVGWLQFTDKFRDMAKTGTPNPWKDDPQLKWLFCGVQVIGALLAILVICI